MRSVNLQLSCVQPPTSSNYFQPRMVIMVATVMVDMLVMLVMVVVVVVVNMVVMVVVVNMVVMEDRT